MKYTLIFFVFLLAKLSIAQQQDSVNFILPTDTLLQKSIHKADSITHSFQSKADSLNDIYQNQLTKIDHAQIKFQSKIDSLNNLKLPTEKLTRKLDSLRQAKDTKIKSLTKEVEDLKSKATNSLKEIQIPQQFQEPMQKLQSSIDGYSLPSLNASPAGIPGLDMPNLGNTQLPTLSNHLNINTNFGNSNITDQLGSIKDITSQAGAYSQDAQNLVKGNLNEVKTIDKTIEGKVVNMAGLDQLKEGSALLGTNPMDSAAMADKAKAILKEEVTKAVQDQFAGKQEVLKDAMSRISKLKNKYSSVKSLSELPKRAPNMLKGKPFIERIVPAVSFQVQKSNSVLLDINVLALYRFTPRISAGAGWNQRLAFDDLNVSIDPKVYGPRMALEVKWTRGINFRLLPEIMNTTIPPFVAQGKGVDPAYREWVPSVFVGIKKDFKIYKTIKGNTEVLYNLYDKDGMSPYGDRMAMRFGFEFPMRNKMKR